MKYNTLYLKAKGVFHQFLLVILVTMLYEWVEKLKPSILNNVLLVDLVCRCALIVLYQLITNNILLFVIKIYHYYYLT